MDKFNKRSSDDFIIGKTRKFFHLGISQLYEVILNDDYSVVAFFDYGRVFLFGMFQFVFSLLARAYVPGDCYHPGRFTSGVFKNRRGQLYWNGGSVSFAEPAIRMYHVPFLKGFLNVDFSYPAVFVGHHAEETLAYQFLFFVVALDSNRSVVYLRYIVVQVRSYDPIGYRLDGAAQGLFCFFLREQRLMRLLQRNDEVVHSIVQFGQFVFPIVVGPFGKVSRFPYVAHIPGHAADLGYHYFVHEKMEHESECYQEAQQ